MNGVYWSEALNKVFVDNFERDPSLIWQYFGSAKGFFRQYPGKLEGFLFGTEYVKLIKCRSASHLGSLLQESSGSQMNMES